MVAYPTYSLPGFTEPVSSLTHLLGAGVFAVLSFFLLRRGWREQGQVVFLGVYAFSSVFLFATSGVYHLLPVGGVGRAVLARLDHGAIFVLIAGTFTPAHGILFRGWGRWGPLLLIWSAAATGITLKTIFFTDLSDGLGLMLYLGMGWIGAVSGIVLWRRYGPWFVQPLLWGGVAYTGGAVLEFLHWPVVVSGIVGPHEIFHIAVLVGAGLHWRFVSEFVPVASPKKGGPGTLREIPGGHPAGRGASRPARGVASLPFTVPAWSVAREVPRHQTKEPGRSTLAR